MIGRGGRGVGEREAVCGGGGRRGTERAGEGRGEDDASIHTLLSFHTTCAGLSLGLNKKQHKKFVSH